MKNLIQLIILILFNLNVFGQKFYFSDIDKRTSVEKMQIKAAVKEIRYENFSGTNDSATEFFKETSGLLEFNSFGNLTKEIVFESYAISDEIQYIYEFKFNEKNFLNETNEYNAKQEVVSTGKYILSENGLKQSFLKTLNSGEITSIDTFKYDLQGKLIYSLINYPSNNITIKIQKEYSSNGNVEKEIFFNSTGKIDVIYLYKFDGENNLIERQELGSNNNLIEKQAYIHDSGDLLIEEQHYNSMNVLKKKYFYEYDKNNNLTSEKLQEMEPVMPINVIKSTTYIYDQKENWIEKKEITDANTYLVKRKISY